MKASRFSPSEVLAAIFGPKCIRCEKRRTMNPSKKCAKCLGAKCCPKCRGMGWWLGTSGPRACMACAGKGTRRVVR